MKSTEELSSVFADLEQRFGFNVAGEGGEYETVVLDAKRFSFAKIVVDDFKVIVDENSGESGYVQILESHLEPKGGDGGVAELGDLLQDPPFILSDGKGVLSPAPPVPLELNPECSVPSCRLLSGGLLHIEKGEQGGGGVRQLPQYICFLLLPFWFDDL